MLKIGDKVKIVETKYSWDNTSNELIGKFGRIISSDYPSMNCPNYTYLVKIFNAKYSAGYFIDKEIVLVKESKLPEWF